MSQSKKGSAVEAVANVFFGYWLAIAFQILIFPLLGIYVSLDTNLGIGVAFSVVSLARSYGLRRLFNWFQRGESAKGHGNAIGQSRKASAAEAFANVFFSYWIAIASQMLIFPLFGVPVSFEKNLVIAAAFSVLSMGRSYVLRRLFNWFHWAKTLKDQERTSSAAP